MTKILLILLVAICFLSLAKVALAEVITLPNPLCQSPTLPTGEPNPACVDSFDKLIANISEYVTDVIAVLAGLMFVVAGIMFVISAGNPERITKARKIAIYAAVGAAIALAGRGLIEVIQEVINTPAA